MNRNDMHVSDELAGTVYRELCRLQAVELPVAATLLLRTFLELSAKRYLVAQGVRTTNGRGFELKIVDLVKAAHDKMKEVEPELDLQPLTRVLAAGSATHLVDHFHSIAHGQGTFASRDSIMAAAAEVRPFLKAVWERLV